MADKSKPRRKELKEKIAASEAELNTEATSAAQHESSSSSRALAFVSDHPGLIVAGGLAAGLLAGALLPKAARRSVTGRAAALAAAASEIGLAFGKQALEKAEGAGKEGRARLHDWGDTLGEKAGDARRKAEDASTYLRDAGLILAKKAIELAATARR